jgi:FkbM family methyltransferase
MHGPATVYDVGMHNGDDSRYYLDKGYDVIGIEANPAFCRLCRERFSEEIATKRMQILNVGVGLREELRDFHINTRESQISGFAPRNLCADEWETINVPVRPLSAIVREYGDPLYIKIDVEHCDHLVLRDLMDCDIVPPYISAEAQSIDVYCALVLMGYGQFKLVQGSTVGDLYRNHTITKLDGTDVRYSFPQLSSGPFGEEVRGDWVDKNDILKRLLEAGLGWIDIHARS